MATSTNSKIAYQKILESLPEKRRQVYEVIVMFGKCTLKHIADHLGCDRSDISGRVTELRDCFLIVECGGVISSRTNNTVTLYRATTEEERVDLVNERYTELRREKDLITNDLNLYKGISQASRRTLLKQIDVVNKKINALKKVI